MMSVNWEKITVEEIVKLLDSNPKIVSYARKYCARVGRLRIVEKIDEARDKWVKPRKTQYHFSKEHKFGEWILLEDVEGLDGKAKMQCSCGEVFDTDVKNAFYGNTTKCMKCLHKQNRYWTDEEIARHGPIIKKLRNICGFSRDEIKLVLELADKLSKKCVQEIDPTKPLTLDNFLFVDGIERYSKSGKRWYFMNEQNTKFGRIMSKFVTEEGKRISKSWGVATYTYEGAIALAEEWYEEQISKLVSCRLEAAKSQGVVDAVLKYKQDKCG